MEKEVFNLANQLSVAFTDYALDIVFALLLLIAGWMVAGWIEKRIDKILQSIERVDATLRSIATNLVRYAILILVIIAVLAVVVVLVVLVVLVVAVLVVVVVVLVVLVEIGRAHV